MKIDLEQLKTLVEAGDTSAIEKHIKTEVLEKGDIKAAAETNPLVKSELDSLNDQHHVKALNTWKENNLNALIEEEVKKRNPDETPEQKRIRELEEKLEKQEKESARAALREKAIKHATEKGYDAKFATKYVDRFLADDETSTQAVLDEFKSDFDAFVQAQVEEKLKGSKRAPGGGTDGGDNGLSYGAQRAQQMIALQKEAKSEDFFE